MSKLDGWRLVPIEATSAMINAASKPVPELRRDAGEEPGPDDWISNREKHRLRWRAMVLAAPPSADGGSMSAQSAIEAVAEAWASIDGKLEQFRSGRGLPAREQPGGYYGGYMHEAEELLKRIRARHYIFVPAGERPAPPPTADGG